MGVYVYATYKSLSERDLFQHFHDVPNSFQEEIHSTIIHSEAGSVGNIDVSDYRGFLAHGSIPVQGKELRIWDRYNGKYALVLVIKSIFLATVHELLMKRYPELTISHKRYVPHITISYDVPKDFDISRYNHGIIMSLDKIKISEYDGEYV